MKKPRIGIIKTDGTNCDQETAYAFTIAGGDAHIVPMHALRSGLVRLIDFHIIALPGGFSYGDDIASGKIFAVELLTCLKDQLVTCLEKNIPIIGICNGFQVLVRTGLLPFRELGSMQVTLVHNDSGKFECRWISMRVEKSPCVFLKNMENSEIMLQVAHGEGKFFSDTVTMQCIENEHLVALRYTHDGMPTMSYPANPNGSMQSIAGICDASGLVFGLMPHPERFVELHQFPNWRISDISIPHGLQIFYNAIQYAR